MSAQQRAPQREEPHDERPAEAVALPEQGSVTIAFATRWNERQIAHSYPFDVEIQSISASDIGWVVKGRGRTHTVIPRRYLGAYQYLTVDHLIAAIFKPIRCQYCGSDAELFTHTILAIDSHDESFDFEVKVDCQECKRRDFSHT